MIYNLFPASYGTLPQTGSDSEGSVLYMYSRLCSTADLVSL